MAISQGKRNFYRLHCQCLIMYYNQMDYLWLLSCNNRPQYIFPTNERAVKWLKFWKGDMLEERVPGKLYLLPDPNKTRNIDKTKRTDKVLVFKIKRMTFNYDF